ncbi:unnamed protein product [Brassica oleracea]
MIQKSNTVLKKVTHQKSMKDIHKRKRNTKKKMMQMWTGKKKGVRPPREIEQQEEDDAEVEHGAKESETSKVNDKMMQMWTTVLNEIKIQKPMK